MVKRLIYIYFFLFLTISGYSQQIKISGVVTNFDNIPVNFVNVSLQGSTTSSYTNPKGEYQITVPAGNDSITVVYYILGYQKTEKKILPTANRTINVMLREMSLGEVTVTGTKAQSSSMKDIEIGNTNLQADISGGSVESIIKTGAGVGGGNNELTSQYSVRGGNYDENIVYVNGTEIYRPLLVRSGQQEGLSFINPNMTQSVKFSTGGYEASYGDKMSSVLDIQYKKPEKFEASAAGSLLGANVYLGSSSKRFTQVTGFRYKTTRSLLGTMDTDAEYEPVFVDAQTYMTLGLSPKWEVSFLGNVSSSVYKFTPQSRETSFGTLQEARNFKVYFDGWEHDKFLTYFGSLGLKGKLLPGLEVGITGSAFSSREHERYDISGEYELTDINLETGGGGDDGSLLGVGAYMEHARNKLNADVINLSHSGSFNFNNHSLKWGASFQKEKIDDAIKEWSVRDSAGYSLPNQGDMVSVYSNLRSNNSINTTRYSGYIQDTYKMYTGDHVIYLNAGIRMSHWSFNDEFLFSPRASVAFVPDGKNLTLRFATGIYYQSPFYKEFQKVEKEDGNNSVVVLNKDIKSQKSIHFVLGSDYSFKVADSRFKFTSELYYKKLSDLIPYTVDNVKIRYSGENVGSGYSMGLDLTLFGEFVKGVDSWISFSLMKTQQTVNGVKAPLPTDQGYNLSLFFQDYLPGSKRLSLNLTGHLAQGLPQAGPGSGYFENGYFRTPAYKRIDIGLAWLLLGEDFSIRNRNSFLGAFKNIRLGADIFNLFDINNTNSYYWITNVFNNQYAVPNYLTGRQFNVKIIAEF